MVILSALAFLVVALYPADAWAWGPSTHLWIGQHVLASLPQIAPETASLISAYRWDYLYGCIGADILFGKNLAEYRYHCHNWSVARELLGRSRNDHHRAFTYGYYTHLAADIVSHNIFVPFQLINFFYKRAFKHTFWEFCVERHVLQELHVSFRRIFQEAARRNNDLLQAELTPTLLNFQTNRLLFSGVMFLDRFRNRRLKQNVYLPATEIHAFLKLALGNARQFLAEGEAAPQWHADPAGLQNIAEARRLRDVLRRSHRGEIRRKRAWKRKGIHLSVHGLPPSPPYPLQTLLEGRFSLPTA